MIKATIDRAFTTSQAGQHPTYIYPWEQAKRLQCWCIHLTWEKTEPAGWRTGCGTPLGPRTSLRCQPAPVSSWKAGADPLVRWASHVGSREPSAVKRVLPELPSHVNTHSSSALPGPSPSRVLSLFFLQARDRDRAQDLTHHLCEWAVWSLSYTASH